jgi:CRISPR system Cascade subunit CasC
MIVELHLLQNFAPSNLNRDDTGAPKDAEFGGVRRARISSQSLKRAMRRMFADAALIPPERRAIRTKRLASAMHDELFARGHADADATALAEALLGALELPVTEGKTQYLVFLGRDEVSRLADAAHKHADALRPSAAGKGVEKKGAKSKKDAAQKLEPEVREELKRLLDGSRAADLALFGRMLADLPEHNVDAAAQVAHAISTHRVQTEFDYYTAVDDLKPQDTMGADMIGTIEFNSACFYRYLNVDTYQLAKNLGHDADLVREALLAALVAAIEAVPTGKQNSMAAHNPPSFLLAVVRGHGAWNLVNAFARPVRPTAELDLIAGSVKALDTYWGELTSLYGEGNGTPMTVVMAGVGDLPVANLASARVPTIATLVDRVLAAAMPAQP